MKPFTRPACLLLAAFVYALAWPAPVRAAGLQISASLTSTNLHLKATTVPAGRLVWFTGSSPDAISNMVQIEGVPVVQHDFVPTRGAAAAAFYRAALFDTNVARVPLAVGATHSLAILTNGEIVCWGDNSLGQFGNDAPSGFEDGGTTGCWINQVAINTSQGPLPESTDTDWVSVAAGSDHCLALKADGTMWSWGDDSAGQLGYAVPGGAYGGFYTYAVPVGTNASWRSVFSYNNSNFAIRDDGTLWAWGDNENSVLGVGTNYSATNTVYLPTQVGAASNWVSVVTWPATYSIGIQSDGSLWAWGSTELPSYVRAGFANTNLTIPVTTSPALVNIPGPWLGAAANPLASRGGTIFLRADGTLWATTTHASDYSTWTVYISYFDNEYTNPASIYNILIGAGATPAEAQSYVTGEFYSIYPNLLGFDFDYTNFLQDTSDANFLVPYSVRGDWSMLNYGIVLNQDGTIWTIGDAQERSPASPRDGDWQRVNTDTDWAYVCNGFAAVKTNGVVWSWDAAVLGGDAITNAVMTNDMVKVLVTNKWIRATVTDTHVVALDTQSNLWVWGANTFGQLGVGDNEPRLAPTPLPMAGPWLDFAAGDYMTVAIRQGGQLWAWGNFNNTGTNTPSPVQLNPGPVWRSVYCLNELLASGRTFAIAQDGTLWTMGDNTYHCLGLFASNLDLTVPQEVAGSNWLSVSPSALGTLALKTDGSLWAWGDVFTNYLGPTTLIYSNLATLPGQVWSNIWAGSLNGFTVRSDRTLWAWGGNDAECQMGVASNVGLLNTNCWSCYTTCGDPNPRVQPYGTNGIAGPEQVGVSSIWQTAKYSQSGYYSTGLQQDGSLWIWGFSPFASITNQQIYLTPATHPYPGLQYPTTPNVLPVPERVGTDTWASINLDDGVTTAGDLYLWGQRNQEGQQLSPPTWLPQAVRSNVVCRLPPAVP